MIKVLLRTEGIPGYDIFTEHIINVDSYMKLPDKIALSYREPMVSANYSISEGSTKRIELYRYGYADGMPYYKRRESCFI